jgi:hypothetical protein
MHVSYAGKNDHLLSVELGEGAGEVGVSTLEGASLVVVVLQKSM